MKEHSGTTNLVLDCDGEIKLLIVCGCLEYYILPGPTSDIGIVEWIGKLKKTCKTQYNIGL
jgi:hypothetical protein